MKFLIVFAFVTLSAISTMAWAAETQTSTSTDKSSDDIILDARSLRKSMAHLATADLSCLRPTDCQLVPVGKSICGGPADYLPTSGNNSHLRSIGFLNLKLIEIMSGAEGEGGVVGPCVIVEPPRVYCASGVCGATRY
ncbi:MAG: hypothetical protein OXB88_08310 [Bacteriovoracales bacterium]|nr:hypothetical protein [Bacteriovoracales bacterium]